MLFNALQEAVLKPKNVNRTFVSFRGIRRGNSRLVRQERRHAAKLRERARLRPRDSEMTVVGTGTTKALEDALTSPARVARITQVGANEEARAAQQVRDQQTIMDKRRRNQRLDNAVSKIVAAVSTTGGRRPRHSPTVAAATAEALTEAATNDGGTLQRTSVRLRIFFAGNGGQGFQQKQSKSDWTTLGFNDVMLRLAKRGVLVCFVNEAYTSQSK